MTTPQKEAKSASPAPIKHMNIRQDLLHPEKFLQNTPLKADTPINNAQTTTTVTTPAGLDPIQIPQTQQPANSQTLSPKQKNDPNILASLQNAAKTVPNMQNQLMNANASFNPNANVFQNNAVPVPEGVGATGLLQMNPIFASFGVGTAFPGFKAAPPQQQTLSQNQISLPITENNNTQLQSSEDDQKSARKRKLSEIDDSENDSSFLTSFPNENEEEHEKNDQEKEEENASSVPLSSNENGGNSANGASGNVTIKRSYWLQYQPEEDELIVQLKEKENLGWKQLADEFNKRTKFGQRTKRGLEHRYRDYLLKKAKGLLNQQAQIIQQNNNSNDCSSSESPSDENGNKKRRVSSSE